MIDFSKIGTCATVDTVIPPREIFNALPNKDANKFQYPRDVQSQVWTKWIARRNEESIVIKMNTGSGKTVVGLLILNRVQTQGRRYRRQLYSAVHRKEPPLISCRHWLVALPGPAVASRPGPIERAPA